MQNVSFALTTAQIRDESKDVTRRLGWENLKPGTRLMACEQCQGIKPGCLVRLAVIRVVSARREPLNAITQDDCRREGFPGMTPEQFIAMFLTHMRWERTPKGAPKIRTTQRTIVTRVEFTYEFTKIEVERGHLHGIWKRDRDNDLRCCVHCGNIRPTRGWQTPCKGKVRVATRRHPTLNDDAPRGPMRDAMSGLTNAQRQGWEDFKASLDRG